MNAIEIEEAVSQNIRNQGSEYCPKLFTYAQALLAINKNASKYGTTGAESKFLGVWNELEDKEEDVTMFLGSGLQPLILAKFITPSEDIKKHPFIDNISFSTFSDTFFTP